MSAPVDVLSVWDELVSAARKNITATEFNAARYAREELVKVLAAPKSGDDAEDGLRYVMCKVGMGAHYNAFLMIPHVDGDYVTATKLDGFSMSILTHALDGCHGEKA